MQHSNILWKKNFTNRKYDTNDNKNGTKWFKSML